MKFTLYLIVLSSSISAYLVQLWVTHRIRKTNTTLAETNEILKQANITLRDTNLDLGSSLYKSEVARRAAHRQLNALGQVPCCESMVESEVDVRDEVIEER